MKKFRCIIVEDIPANAKDLIEKLQEHCPQVEVICTSSSCKMAVEHINNQRPNLLFLDIKLPDGDGFTVLEQIEDNALPVIFTTGYMEYEYLKRAMDLSAVDYLEKPINPERLTAAVAKATELRSKHELQMQSQLLVATANAPSSSPTEIVLHSDGKLHFIDPREIIHAASVTGLEKSVVYFASDGKENKLVCQGLLRSLAEKLESLPYLMRTSRSDLVNLRKIKTYDKSIKILKLKGCDAHHASVGEAYEDDFFERLKKLGILM